MGKLRAPEILIAPTGEIDGEISAFELQIYGSISGSIEARDVLLASTAVLHADITQVRITVEAGAQIEGWLRRKS